MKKALILIDIQNDFCPQGSLPVPDGDKIVPVVNELMDKNFDLIVATKDWHPPKHISFARTHDKKVGEVIEIQGQKQILWPDHCIQNTWGAEFHPNLKANKIHKIVFKGTDPHIDSYSGFFDNAKLKNTELDDVLKSNQITHVYLVGLATDYCVKFTAIDALNLGYQTFVILDGCKAVNLQPEDEQKTIQDLKSRGIKIIFSKEVNF
ncbi:MAG: bifunctional nicotinamidase/pyrazinamidase [Desulfonauticus sp.]|nr:bifunctional nicotinamidase/pyrazinamidase [Desulfonauticus sp.]